VSYISAIRKNDEVIVWERTPEGRTFKLFHAPYYFYLDAEIGNYTFEKDGREYTIHPESGIYQYFKTNAELRKYVFTRRQDFQRAREALQNDGIEMFESDIPSEIRILSEYYYQQPTPNLNVTFLDIEVDYDPLNGFSSIDNPYAPINSVALYHRWLKKFVVLCVPPSDAIRNQWSTNGNPSEAFHKKLDEISPLPKNNVEIIFCDDERELLLNFLVEIEDSDILSGWNSEFFDMPYIAKRLELLGKGSDRYLRKLNFDNAPDAPIFKEALQNETTGQTATTIELVGRVHFDYLLVFKKYEQSARPSYKLENIGEEIVPDLPKLQYEGSLADLYRKDFVYFVRYNLRDTEVLEGFEQKLGYIQLANEMYHMSTGVSKHVLGTIKLSELAVINECHHELGGLIVNDVHRPDIDRQIKGALVLYPQIGEHQYVGSIDIKSLYPSSILTINISPETLRGQFPANEFAFECISNGTEHELMLALEDGTIEEHTADEWRTILWERKWAISGWGTVFDQSKMGIIPTILDKWFNKRIEYQKLMKQAKEVGDKDKADYYDRLQYIFKIKLNSFYGALSNLFFRFYDLRMGESTTGTGRAIVKHQCRKTTEVLGGSYDVDFPLYDTVKDAEEHNADPSTALHGPLFNGQFQSESVVYGDTDSTYFETYADNKDSAIKIANAVAKKVNESYSEFVKKTFLCQPGFDNRITCSREVVTGRGIFVDKKRYILHILDLDGKPPKGEKELKVMGLDTKKTTLPKDVSKKINSFIERYLKGEPWDTVALDIVDYKEKILTTDDIMSIGLPKGVKGIENYQEAFKLDKTTFLPGHVAAGILYNLCCERFNDKKSIRIRSGMKIKVFYLTHDIDRFKSIAIPVDIEEVPKWFFDNFEVDREMHLERLVDNPLKNIIKAIGKEVPSKQSLFVDSVLEW
jgi:DNA polymerase elongation subunit (family B)